MSQTLLSKEDVMMLWYSIYSKEWRKGKTLFIEESRKKDFIRETQLENFSSEKRKFLVKLLVQNTELKLACKEEKGSAKYIIEKFFQARTLDISDEEFLQQEIIIFQQKLGRITQLKEKGKNR